MMSNASSLKYPDSTWSLQHLLCGNTNTPVWIKARVEAAWGMLDKEFLLFPSCLQTRQYLWLLGVYAISKEIDFGLLRVGFNSVRGFTNGSSIWDFFYVHCHSLCFLYTLALQQLHITSTLNTFLPISFSTWCRKRIPGGTCRLEFSLYRLTTKSIILVKASANNRLSKRYWVIIDCFSIKKK